VRRKPRPALPPQLYVASRRPPVSLGSRDPGKAGPKRRPTSQETCPDTSNVLGRGVPVARLRFQRLLPHGFQCRVAMAFAPTPGVSCVLQAALSKKSERLVIDKFHPLRRALTQYAIRGAITATAALPLGPQRSIVRRVVGLAGGVPMLRRRVRENMQLALGDDVPEGAERRYFQRVAWVLSRSLATFHRGIASAAIADDVKFDETLAVLDDAVAQGRGVVFTTPHWAGHELEAAVVSRRHPMVMLVRQAPTKERADRKAAWYRALGAETVLRPVHGSTIKDAVACLSVLKRGRLLGITPDLLADPDHGVPVTLFGRPARLPAGAFALALAARAPIIRFSGRWQSDSSVVLRFERAPPPGVVESREAAIRACAQDWCDWFEAKLRANPENWLFWLDRRWSRFLRQTPRLDPGAPDPGAPLDPSAPAAGSIT
jgi:lauroyl/myristoyl acyltransferase